MFKTCIKCGKIIPASMGSRCAEHPNRWRSGSTREWKKTRARIFERDGFRCTTHTRPGERCPETRLLEVHHVYGGDALVVPDEQLRTVCRKHNPAAADAFPRRFLQSPHWTAHAGAHPKPVQLDMQLREGLLVQHDAVGALAHVVHPAPLPPLPS
jgi:hypothetical protein